MGSRRDQSELENAKTRTGKDCLVLGGSGRDSDLRIRFPLALVESETKADPAAPLGAAPLVFGNALPQSRVQLETVGDLGLRHVNECSPTALRLLRLKFGTGDAAARFGIGPFRADARAKVTPPAAR